MKARHAFLALALGPACAGATGSTGSIAPSGLRGIDFAPRVAVLESSPVQIGGSIAVTNRRGLPVLLTFPPSCPARLRVYEEDRSRVVPVWDQAGTGTCAAGPQALDLEPGQSADLRLPVITVAEILGDSLPAGTYRVTVYLEPDGNVIEVEVGRFDLAARGG